LDSNLLKYADIKLTKNNTAIMKHIYKIIDSSETFEMPKTFLINLNESVYKINNQQQTEISITDSITY